MIKRLNEEKDKVNRLVYLLIAISIVAPILGTVLILTLSNMIYIGILVLVIAAIIVIYLTVITTKKHKEIKKQYFVYIQKILADIHFIEHSENEVKVDRKEFMNLHIIPSFTSAKVENKISGVYDHTRYALYDVTATVQSGNTTSIAFSGRVYELEIPNNHLHTIYTENKYFRIKNTDKRKIENTKITEYKEANSKTQFLDSNVIKLFKNIHRNDKSRLTVKVTRNKIMISISRTDKLFQYKYFAKLNEISFLSVEKQISDELDNIIYNIKNFLEEF